MTKYQKFARIWVGQLLWEHEFDRNSVNCPDEEKDLIESAINDQFFKLLGQCGLMTPQDIYDVTMADDSK